jgi:hypothetical protein
VIGVNRISAAVGFINSTNGGMEIGQEGEKFGAIGEDFGHGSMSSNFGARGFRMPARIIG